VLLARANGAIAIFGNDENYCALACENAQGEYEKRKPCRRRVDSHLQGVFDEKPSLYDLNF